MGAKLLFCFHGYGRDSDTFSILERELGKSFTIIALDTPFHGKTTWKEDLIIDPNKIAEFIKEIKISINPGLEKVSLMGFSMGGRIALYLTQIMPGEVERLLLLAPDGLKNDFWRWLISDTWAGKTLLASVVKRPRIAIKLIETAERLRVLHKSMGNYVRFYIEEEEYRMLVYHRYISMQRFKPSLPKLRKIVKSHNIQVRMLFGKFDRIISYHDGEDFRKGAEEKIKLSVVEAGHHLLSYMHTKTIAKLLSE